MHRSLTACDRRARLGVPLRRVVLYVALAVGCTKPEPNTPAAPAAADGAPARAEASSPEAAPASEAAAGDEAAAPSAGNPKEIDLDGEDDGLDADIAALSETTQAPASTGAPAELSGRDIIYRVTPGGLIIEIDGIHLEPRAKAVKDKAGFFGVELTVQATSFDGRQYWLEHPKAGPLSIAGKVVDKAGKATRFSDRRDAAGQREEVVTAGNPRSFKQRWPGPGQPKLAAGQTVTLEVGLWGVRADSERERPVRRLFEVKMVGGARSPAVITPPTLDWGS